MSALQPLSHGVLPDRTTYRRWRSLPAVRWIFAVVLIVTAAQPALFANEEGSQDPSLPQELLDGEVHGSMPKGMAPQSRADLERTRDEAYGLALSADQHQRIDSWRVDSLPWWKDSNRMLRAHMQRADLADHLASLSGALPAASLSSSFLGHPDAFGARIQPIHDQQGFDGAGAETKPATAFHVVIDATKRPDFFAFDSALADVTTIAVQLRAEDPQAANEMLLEIFPGLVAEDTVGGHPAFEDFWRLTEAFVEARAKAIRGAQADAVEPAILFHRDRGGQLFNSNAFRSMNRAITEAAANVSRETMELYLDTLPESFSKPLQQYVMQTYLPSLEATMTFQSAEGVAESVETVKANWAANQE